MDSSSRRAREPARYFEMARTDERGGAVRLALQGELDLAMRPEFETTLLRLGRAGAHVILDLACLEFIDSSGIGALIDGFVEAERSGWTLEILPGASEPVRRVLELTGVDRIFWPSVASA